MAMSTFALFAFLLCAAPPAAAGLRTDVAAVKGKAKVTPIEKVIALLEDLKAEVEKDGAAEGDTYNKFACFCKDTTKTKSDSILAGKDAINSLSAEIAQKTALKGEKEDELKATLAKQEELTATLKQTEADCAVGLAAYEASDADLTKAISSLKGAIDTLEKSKPTGGAAAAGLIKIKDTVQSSLAMADALQMIEDGPKWSAAAAFLQAGTGVDPSDPEYKFHSQGIIKIITDLLATFTKKKEEADLEEKERVQTCTDTIANLNSDLDLAAQKIAALESEIGELAKGIASARSSLVTAEATLKDDKEYLKDLTSMCEDRAKDFDQRAATRSDEISTLTQALAVLKDDVATRTKVNVRALLQKQQVGSQAAVAVASTSSNKTTEAKAAPSFLQESSRSLRGSGRDGEKTQEQKQEERRNRALDSLREAGSKMHSTTLLALASRASAGPFEKVKVMIEKLIERLIKEATEEATKKGYCDTSLAKAEKDRTFRYEETLMLNAELYALEIKKEALELEISELTTAIADLTADLKTATENREAEKAVNMEILKTAKEGDVAITEAILILKTYYSEAAKATDNLGKYSQLQANKYSPVEDDTTGAGFEGNYAGKQDAMKAIMGLLQVIKSDFDRTVRKTTEAEADAHAAFVKYDRATKADIASKTTKKELDEDDLKTTDTTIATKMEEMQKNMDLVDEANKELEALKPMCIDSGMSYAERVANREEEIEHLKTALCILDEKQVEPECAR
jgi:hypothetical protein